MASASVTRASPLASRLTSQRRATRLSAAGSSGVSASAPPDGPTRSTITPWSSAGSSVIPENSAVPSRYRSSDGT
jgi:hypothetical protein